jgi:hypothetical protein
VDCTAVECGDGLVNHAAGEGCDDGGESVGCDSDCTPASCDSAGCRDGFLNNGEQDIDCGGPCGRGSCGREQLCFAHSDDEPPSAAGDVDVGGAVLQLTAGGWHTCTLLTTNAVRCWGSGWGGQLGYGNTNHIGDNEHPSTAGDVDIGGSLL